MKVDLGIVIVISKYLIQRHFYTKRLFDPLEKHFDVPSTTIKFSDGKSRQVKVIGEEDESFVVVDIVELHTSQRQRIELAGIFAGEEMVWS